MKILVTGAKGQLGSILSSNLSPYHEVHPMSSARLDIINKAKVYETIKQIRPDIIINCSAYNKVDMAEQEREQAKNVNEIGVENLAIACQSNNCKIVHISTDFVFDGKKDEAYVETDKPNPINYYGQTKYNGEKVLEQLSNNYLLIRTAWLYSHNTNNFVHNIQQIARKNKSINVIDDQIGTPTNAYELAKVIEKLILEKAKGLYHCTGNGSCSWYNFATAIIQRAGIACDVRPIASKDFVQTALRPKFSVLDNKQLRDSVGDPMKSWDESLESYFK